MKCVIPAKMEYLSELLEFIENFMLSSTKELGISEPCYETINILLEVSDEIFSNIVNYAGMSIEENVDFNVEFNPDKVVLEFRDKGKKFNPLTQEIPTDIPRGNGNGLRMILERTDEQKYVYEDGHNIFTVSKNM